MYHTTHPRLITSH